MDLFHRTVMDQPLPAQNGPNDHPAAAAAQESLPTTTGMTPEERSEYLIRILEEVCQLIRNDDDTTTTTSPDDVGTTMGAVESASAAADNDPENENGSSTWPSQDPSSSREEDSDN